MNKSPTRIPDDQGQVRYARLEATPFGLALVDDEPICDEGARLILEDIERQVREIEARRTAPVNEAATGSPTPPTKR